MILSNKSLGKKRVLFYANWCLIIDVTLEQLCDIAVASVEIYKKLMGKELKMAIPSFLKK